MSVKLLFVIIIFFLFWKEIYKNRILLRFGDLRGLGLTYTDSFISEVVRDGNQW